MAFLESSFALNPYIGSAVLVLTTCFLTWHLWNRKAPNSLPGSRGFPLFGVVFSLGNFPERIFEKWGKIYGPLYGLKVGTMDLVIISSPDIAYEAFAKNDCFNDRPQSVPLFKDGKGVVFLKSTDFHREQRRFGLFTLREFGMGRRSLEPRLVEISRQLCDKIDTLCGRSGRSESFQIHQSVYEAISNIISCIIFGHDVGEECEEFKKLIFSLFNQEKGSSMSGMVMVAPFLRHLPVFSDLWERNLDFQRRFHDQIKKEIVAHQTSHDPNNPRDFIDCFLNEMHKAGQNDLKGEGIAESSSAWKHSYVSNEEVEECSSDWKPYSSFFFDQLVSLIRDIFIAGTDTTSSTISWIVLFLSKYPDVQKKMQEEIDNVLGQSGIPKMSLMEKLPYVRAVIQEVSRLRPTVPLDVPHMASRDATLMGYHIPKGAIILTNIWAIGHDENRWPEPEKFLPERHLDDNGKFVKSPNWMIFGVGTRSCLGQQLAVMELFITTVSLFQRFDFSFPPGYIPDMDGQSVISLRPLHFDLIATRR